MVGVDYKLEGRLKKSKNARHVQSVSSSKRGMRFNMQGWDPEIITASERALTKPVIHLAQFAYARIKRRTFKRATDANGRPWGQYSAREPKSGRKPKRQEGHTWVGPQKPQPKIGAYPIRIKSGPWKGWALYQSPRQYAQSQGKSGINFVNTGTLAQGMQIRPLSPLSVKLAFYGGRRKTHDRIMGGSDDATGGRRSSQEKNNAKLSGFLARKGYRLIELNKADRVELLRLMQRLLTPSLINMLKLVDDAVKGRKALRSRTNAIRKIERQFKLADDIKSGKVKEWPT